MSDSMTLAGFIVLSSGCFSCLWANKAAEIHKSMLLTENGPVGHLKDFTVSKDFDRVINNNVNFSSALNFSPHETL